jgi:hypothetical protein
MINVNQITAQLAKMPDQALQQYAAMHKNDPYTVSLALSESNRRKQMRNASQGAQGMQPQPKVVDQAVAGMSPQPQMQPQMPQGQAQAMPEDSGIAQLPAGNMNFAEGGIISFAGGGEVQRFDAGGAVDAARAQRQAAQQTLYRYGLRQRRDDPQGFADAQANLEAATVATNAAEQAYQTEMSRSGMGAAMNRSSIGATGQFGPPDAATPTMTAAPAVNVAAPVVPPAPAAPPNVSPADTTLGAKTPPPPRADAGIKNLLAPRAPAAAPRAPAAAPALSFMEQYKKNMGADDANSPTAIAAERKRMSTEEVAAETAAKDARKTEQAEEMKTLFKGRDERADKREGELGKSKETNTGMAFLEAGLAMMQSKGRGLAGIAQGAGVGAKAYSAGLDKIKSAQEKLDEARDRTEELRQNQSSMNKREIRDAEKGIRSLVAKGNSDQIDARAAIYGEKKAVALAGTTSDIAIAQDTLNRRSRESIAASEQSGANVRSAAQIAATLNTPDRLVFDQLMKDNNQNAVKAAESLQKMKSEKFNVYDAYSKYLIGFAGKETLTPPQSFDKFASQFTIPTTTAPGKGATLLKQP